jgi:hypothetical protein
MLIIGGAEDCNVLRFERLLHQVEHPAPARLAEEMEDHFKNKLDAIGPRGLRILIRRSLK